MLCCAHLLITLSLLIHKMLCVFHCSLSVLAQDVSFNIHEYLYNGMALRKPYILLSLFSNKEAEMLR